MFYESPNELATVSTVFRVDSVLTDPTAVTLAVTDPLGVTTTYAWPTGSPALTHPSTGVFTVDIPCTSDGVWQGVWNGTNAASDTDVVTWTVLSTDLQQLYCTPNELKSRVGITDDLDDFEIRLAVEAASRMIDDMCERRFWRGTETRTYTASHGYQVDVDDLVSVTTLKTDTAGDATWATTWATTDYRLLPVNPSSYGMARPYNAIRAVGSLTFPTTWGVGRTDLVQVVGVFGWPTVPSAVKQACLLASSELLKLKGAPFGVAGFGEFGAVRVRQNPHITMLLAPYRHRPVKVA